MPNKINEEDLNKISGGATKERIIYLITDECIMCGACLDECPMQCIKEGNEHYVIDENSCSKCGTCVSNCPVRAIERIKIS